MPNASNKSLPAPEAGGATDPEIVRRLAARMRALEAAPPLGVAVSGGGDSMALSHLLARAAPLLNIQLTDIFTLTVDHGLRSGSAEEAQHVGRSMRALGLPHETLKAEVSAAGPGLQAAARRARYGLMLDWCVRRGVRTLLTAHTADDQAETLLMRLARGSGVDGLSGIAPVRVLEAVDGARVRLLRALLDEPRAALRAYLKDQGLGWSEDPSNENPAFDRVRARHALALLTPLGLSRDRLVKTAAQMARARAALEAAADRLEGEAVTWHDAGYALADPALLACAPRENALRVLARVLMAVSGAPYRPRLEKLERALDALCGGASAKSRTLGGCRLVPRPDGRVLVCREARAAAGPVALAPGGVAVWDNRFRVRLAQDVEAGEIRSLGMEGLSRLRGEEEFNARNIPHPARSSLPCFFRAGTAVAAPHLGVNLPGLGVERLADVTVLRFPPPDATPRAQEGWFSDGGTLF